MRIRRLNQWSVTRLFQMNSPNDIDSPHSGGPKSWLERPITQWQCVIGWLIATAVFVGLCTLLGGPTQADAEVSIYSTWAIAHGHLSCAYPPSSSFNLPLTAPLYPLLSGGLSALFRIGHSVPFPNHTQLGAHCQTAFNAISQWSTRSNAIASTLRIGYLGWLALMGGVVSLLRTCGRGRCVWEPTVLLFTAVAPPVFMCIQGFFHPQDLLAMGLALGGMACARLNRWAWSGSLLGLAFISQQFAILVLVPLAAMTLWSRRFRFITAALVSASVIIAPLVVVTSGRAMKSAVIGSGQTQADQGTVMWELHLHGPVEMAISRGVPIALAIFLAMWVLKRTVSTALEPAVLISLVATALSFRLVFEEILWGYYCMATAVTVIVLEATAGRIRPYLCLWLALVMLAFDPLRWGHDPLWHAVPYWFWQALLVPSIVALASGPLLALRRNGHPQIPAMIS